ncbi:GFA family protein [Teredinibacter haidensis]|mgnify:CR=1 FL=1|uniref:GFA family protein n=1 Tax=Teredinibacter haidensis TaxID=2731755 RepID=UPI000948F299|nr:GFA family protein [Teredinibacter haidensis]
MSTPSTGTCLCGKVTITPKHLDHNLGACHCTSCRKWSGGPLLAVDCGTDCDIEGEEYVSVFNSSEWAERGFCKNCGSNLFYRLKQSGQYILPVGLFDDDEAFEFDHQIFIDSKPEYYSFANKTKNMTGEEVFAQYAEPES